MGKQTSATHVSRPPTADELLGALAKLAPLEDLLTLKGDDDSPLAILKDACDELLLLRALREKVMQQQNELNVFFMRK